MAKPCKPYRIISYDFESQQVKQQETNMRKHIVNFICAKIICTQCITNGSWNRPLQQSCNICGDYRTRTWSPFEISDIHSDNHKQTDSPLTDFTEWLLDGDKHDPDYKSICFAHFVSIRFNAIINFK